MEAYVVHIDMVSREEVRFKLTKLTISTLGNALSLSWIGYRYPGLNLG
jgi:hypothetical protein